MDITHIMSEFIYNFYKASNKRKVIIGVNGPQGSGKSTSCNKCVTNLKERYKLKAIILSLDDYYYPYNKLVQIKSDSKTNRLYDFRGNPGTHETNLILENLTKIIDEKEQTFYLPRFDKSLRNGLGDRTPKKEFVETRNDIDVILFEGWMIHYTPLSKITLIDLTKINELLQNHNATYKLTIQELNHINTRLREYIDLWTHIDCLIIFKAENFSNIFKWRIQQESKNGLSTYQIKEFVSRFLPAYELYYEKLWKIDKKKLVIELGDDHKIIKTY